MKHCTKCTKENKMTAAHVLNHRLGYTWDHKLTKEDYIKLDKLNKEHKKSLRISYVKRIGYSFEEIWSLIKLILKR